MSAREKPMKYVAEILSNGDYFWCWVGQEALGVLQNPNERPPHTQLLRVNSEAEWKKRTQDSFRPTAS